MNTQQLLLLRTFFQGDSTLALPLASLQVSDVLRWEMIHQEEHEKHREAHKGEDLGLGCPQMVRQPQDVVRDGIAYGVRQSPSLSNLERWPIVEEHGSSHMLEVGQSSWVLAEGVTAKRDGAYDVVGVDDIIEVFGSRMPCYLIRICGITRARGAERVASF